MGRLRVLFGRELKTPVYLSPAPIVARFATMAAIITSLPFARSSHGDITITAASLIIAPVPFTPTAAVVAPEIHSAIGDVLMEGPAIHASAHPHPGKPRSPA